MSEQDSWAKYVDEVLSELPMGGDDNSEMMKLFRANRIGEYEPGIKPEDFKKILEGLETGEIIGFHFKGSAKWPMVFLAFFSTRKSCFEYIEDQLPSFEGVSHLALMGRPGSSFWVKCRIRNVPICAGHNVDWIVRYLGVSLKEVTVEKPA
jgi:hypothetical protein